MFDSPFDTFMEMVAELEQIDFESTPSMRVMVELKNLIIADGYSVDVAVNYLATIDISIDQNFEFTDEEIKTMARKMYDLIVKFRNATCHALGFSPKYFSENVDKFMNGFNFRLN